MNRRLSLTIRTISLCMVLVVIATLAAACGNDPTPTATAPPKPTATAVPVEPTATPKKTAPIAAPKKTAPTATPDLRSASTKIPLVADFQTIPDAIIERLYKEALVEAAAGGELLTYLFSPNKEHEVFMERFPGITEQVVTAGLARPAKIIQEHEAGQRTADWQSGSIAQVFPLVDRGLTEEFDWGAVGVPEVMIEPELNSWVHSVSSWSLNFNGDVLQKSDVPTDLNDLLDPKWKGKLVGSPFFVPPALGSWGLRYGKDKAVELGKALVESGNLLLTNNPNPLLFSGERPILLFHTSGNAVVNSRLLGGPLDFRHYEGSGLFFTHAVVVKGTKVPSTVALKAVWSVTPEHDRLAREARAGWAAHPGPLADMKDPNIADFAANESFFERETLENWILRNEITQAVRGAVLTRN